MMIDIAELGVDRRQALEIVTDCVLHGHADTAMQLNRLLTNEAGGAPDFDFHRAHLAPARYRILVAGHHRSQHGHRTRAFDRHHHVGGAVLQGLEGADGAPELLAGAQVIECQAERGLHGTHRLGRQGRDGLVHHSLG